MDGTFGDRHPLGKGRIMTLDKQDWLTNRTTYYDPQACIPLKWEHPTLAASILARDNVYYLLADSERYFLGIAARGTA